MNLHILKTHLLFQVVQILEIPYDFVTGSYFQPYITTIGLYNGANQLVAVGKLSQPLQSSNVSDTTILVNLDL